MFASVLLLSGCNNDSNSKAELNFPTPDNSSTLPDLPEPELPITPEPPHFSPPLVAVETSRSGTIYHHNVAVESTGDNLAITIMECSGLMKPDIYLGDNVRHKEVLYDKQTTYFYSRIQTRSR